MDPRFTISLAAALVLIGFLPPLAAARTSRVCLSGCTYSNIQSAVNAAQTGNTIEIRPAPTPRPSWLPLSLR